LNDLNPQSKILQALIFPYFPCIFDATVHLTSSDGSFIETPDRFLKSRLGPPASNPLCQNRHPTTQAITAKIHRTEDFAIA